jgi:lipopolysaccharide export system protein LptC
MRGVLEVDYDGDGVQDTAYDTEGEIAIAVTYDTLTEAIQILSLKSVFKKPLLVMVKVAEKAYQKSLKRGKYKKHEMIALQVLKKQIVLYEKRRLITKVEGQNIISIIESLIKK